MSVDTEAFSKDCSIYIVVLEAIISQLFSTINKPYTSTIRTLSFAGPGLAFFGALGGGSTVEGWMGIFGLGSCFVIERSRLKLSIFTGRTGTCDPATSKVPGAV